MNSIASRLSQRLWPWGILAARSRLFSVQAVEREGIAVLGSVPRFKQQPSSAYPTDDHPHARNAYARIAASIEAGKKALVITSASPEEGKSTTAANLATALARTGRRVILVDADLRWSSLRSTGHQATPGLSGLLVNHYLDPQHAALPTRDHNLYLLPAGDLPSQPEMLLSSSRLPQVIEALSQSFDHVVIDTPPLLEARDAALLGAAGDATIVVIDAGKTKRAHLAAALRMLANAGVTPLGAVLNRAAIEATSKTSSEGPMAAALAASWKDAPVIEVTTAAVAEDQGTALTSEPASMGGASLRLLQPHERPLLTFDKNPATAQRQDEAASVKDDALEITVEELLVDLEETLSLIRYLKQKHAPAADK